MVVPVLKSCTNMRMCVYDVFVCVFLYVCEYVFKSSCVCVNVYIYMHSYTRAHTHVHLHTHTHGYVHTHINVCTHIHASVHTSYMNTYNTHSHNQLHDEWVVIDFLLIGGHWEYFIITAHVF